jgi:hypothetical protein
MTVFVAFHAIAVGVAKVITTVSIRVARRPWNAKAAVTNSGVAMTGGQAFDTLTLGGIAITAGAI